MELSVYAKATDAKATGTVMRHIDINQLVSFKQEVDKLAGVGSFLSGFGGRALVGAGAGAALGAGTAAEGERFRGGFRGALLGGAAGLGSKLVTRAGRQEAKEGLRTFGNAQRYALTGGGPGKVLPQGASPALRESFEKGYENLPGLAKGLATKPLDVVRSGWKKQDTLGKVFTGLSAYDAAKQVATSSEPGGPGRAERTLGSLGASAGYLVGPGGFLPGMAAGTIGGFLGKKSGKLMDRMAGRKQVPVEQESA